MPLNNGPPLKNNRLAISSSAPSPPSSVSSVSTAKRWRTELRRRQMGFNMHPHFMVHPRMATHLPRLPLNLPPTTDGMQQRKFGFFFNQTLPSTSTGGYFNERRKQLPLKKISNEVQTQVFGVNTNASTSNAPPTVPRIASAVEHTEKKPVGESDVELNNAINELFAKLVWKKLDLIRDVSRLSNLHTEIMNVLQQAVAEDEIDHIT